MGKKSSPSSPQPDPRVGIAMDKQADLAQQQQYWYEHEIYPWMRQQTETQNRWSKDDRLFARQNADFWQQYSTENTDRINKRADELYERWNTQYKPIEDSLIADAKNYNTSAEAQRQAGYAIADTSNQFAQQQKNNAMQMQAYGIDPTAGAYQAQNNNLGVQQATATAAAANQARQAAIDLGWQKKMQVSALGNQTFANSLNMQNTANQTANVGGGLANQSIGQASQFGQLGTQNIGALANQGMQNYGALQNSWGNYGNLGMQMSNYNQQAWQQQQQSNAQNSQAAGSAIGSIAGMAVAF